MNQIDIDTPTTGDNENVMDVIDDLTKNPDTEQQELEQEPNSEKVVDIPEWKRMLEASALRREHIMECENAELLVPEVPIMKGQLTYWYGFPGCGKTTAAMAVASLAAGAGYEVYYFQVDVSGTDLKVYYEMADAAGFTIQSLLAEGTTLKSLQETIQWIAMEGKPEDLKNVVIVLDTFKKFTPGGDVNHKKGNVQLFACLRQISMKGGTVLILGHATKDRDDDGLPRFAGTQEIQDDSDSLICLDHAASPDGSEINVNAIVKKSRSMYSQNWGFTIKLGATLADNLVEFGPPFDTDIQQARLREGIRVRSSDLVGVICQEIGMCPGINQSNLVNQVRGHYEGRDLNVPGEKRVRNLLNSLEGDEWHAETDPGANNSKRYTLNDEFQPPTRVKTDQGGQTDQSGQTS